MAQGTHVYNSLSYPWAMTGTVDDGWAEGHLDYWMPLPRKPGEPK
jgi:hypothetical protein